jgi:hypothetical protein
MDMEILVRIICGFIGIAGIFIFLFLGQVFKWIIEDIKQFDFIVLIADSVCFIALFLVSMFCIVLGYAAIFAH